MLQGIWLRVVQVRSGVVGEAKGEGVLPAPGVRVHKRIEAREGAGAGVQFRMALVQIPGIFPEESELRVVAKLALDGSQRLDLLSPGQAKVVPFVQEDVEDLWSSGGATVPELLYAFGVEGFVVSGVACGDLYGVGGLGDVFDCDDLGLEGQGPREVGNPVNGEGSRRKAGLVVGEVRRCVSSSQLGSQQVEVVGGGDRNAMDVNGTLEGR